jgi:asparagine synthase (glutamine-hydrolysing)
MCGIVGILTCHLMDDRKVLNTLQNMARSLSHRGPDDEGFWLEDKIALGHRRLSVLDLSSAGAQPMQSQNGRYVIVFNGEIYNHLDMRIDIAKDGVSHDWRGHSDTETLLEGISHWGLEETLCRAKGMFALALWDRSRKRMSLARDRMGEKPLYWGWAGKAIVFGSELKAIRAHSNFSNEVCRKALAQYLRFMYVPSPRSIHPGLFKLEPGTILTVDCIAPTSPPSEPIRPGTQYGSIDIRRYWNLNEEISTGAKDQITDESTSVATLDKLLSKAVRRQMISDVPLGAFLSGGVDSSCIVALMQLQSVRPVQTFTIGFDDKAYDESLHAAAVARHLGTNHTKLHVTDTNVRDVIPDLPDIYDEPFADTSQIPTYLICHAARQHVTVALSGDAGDELFGGYNRYIRGPNLWKRLSKVPKPIRNISGISAQALPEKTWDMIGSAYNRLRPGSAGISGLGAKVHRLGERLRLINSINDLHHNMASTWVEPETLLIGKISEPTSQFDDPVPVDGIDDPAQQMMLKDMRSYLPDDILCKVDRAAMGVSLEIRTPFLDPDVIRLSTQLPIEMKIRDFQGKWALRQVLYQYVPPHIIERPKVGFSIPVGAWLRGPLRGWVEEMLSHKRLSEDGFFDPDIIHKTWTEHLSGRRDWTARLWTILMFQAWYSHWS